MESLSLTGRLFATIAMGTVDEEARCESPFCQSRNGSPDGSFITGSDFLMDGGVTAAYWYGDLAPK